MRRRSSRPAVVLTAALLALSCAGCIVFRAADYALPARRLDRPGNLPLPDRDDERVRAAIEAWREAPEADRECYPTPYHRYVDSPAPGSFEGELAVGLAFSGGGTRGQVFGAACYRLLESLAVRITGPEGPMELSITGEADYISGVSTGALPAALLALDYGGACPPGRGTEYWPDALNVDIQGRALRRLGLRPWVVARDCVFETNSRPTLIAVMTEAFFTGPGGSASVFADLPGTPVLLLPATWLSNPAGPFIQTRLPYRHYLEPPAPPPWAPPLLQTFENTGTDPMPYSLAEACYNSISYPGLMRSGLMRVYEDPDWLIEPGSPAEELMRRARQGLPPGTVLELKDGGLTDNRAVFVIGDIFERLVGAHRDGRPPLLVSFDASVRLLQPQDPPPERRAGWLREFGDSYLALWQANHRVNHELAGRRAREAGYHLVRLELAAWVPSLSPVTETERVEADYLAARCAEEPAIGTVDRFVEVMRNTGTSMSALSEDQMAALRIAARFAVWKGMGDLGRWAEACGGHLVRAG